MRVPLPGAPTRPAGSQSLWWNPRSSRFLSLWAASPLLAWLHEPVSPLPQTGAQRGLRGLVAPPGVSWCWHLWKAGWGSSTGCKRSCSPLEVWKAGAVLLSHGRGGREGRSWCPWRTGAWMQAWEGHGLGQGGPAADTALKLQPVGPPAFWVVGHSFLNEN